MPRTRRVIVMILLLLSCSSGAAWMNARGRPESDPIPVRRGSDAADLSRGSGQTGFSVIGRVTINRRIPMPHGYIVAYDRWKTRAVASSPLNKSGEYALTEVPPEGLFLLVKQEINENPNLSQPTPDPAFASRPRKTPSERARNSESSMIRQSGAARGPKSRPEYVSPVKFIQDRPSEVTLDKIRFDESSPEYEMMWEVQWLIHAAFLKFDHFSKERKGFLVPPADDDQERIYNFDLSVP